MRKQRGRPPRTPQTRHWLTNDPENEESAPWVRINITKKAFRPPTLFNYDHHDQRDFFDWETSEIKREVAKCAREKKRKAATQQKTFREIVNLIENHELLEDPLRPSMQEEEDIERPAGDLRTKYMRDRRQSIREIGPENLLGFTESMQVALRERLDEILSQPTYQEQLYLVLDILNNTEIPAIARMFGVTQQTIRTHARRKAVPKQPVGRPTLLNGTEMAILKNHISELYFMKKVPNIPTLLQYIADQFEKDVSSDTLLSVLARNEIGKTCQGHPIDKCRHEADQEEIVEFFDELSSFLEENRVPDSFCFNVDESGFQPWADRTPELVVIPVDAEDKKVFFPVDRSRKRASLVAAIAADGTYLAPLIIIPRKTIEKEMLACGYRPELNHFIVSQECGFITGLIWDFWVESVFIPEVQRRRRQYQYSGEVVLLLDGCSAHSTDFFLEECLYNGITIFELPAHASDQVQPLDLGVFAIQKRATKKVRPAQRFSEQSKELITICSSWQQVATPTNISAAFAEAGLTKMQLDGDERFYMQASIKHAQQVRGIDHEPVDYRDSKTQIKAHAF